MRHSKRRDWSIAASLPHRTGVAAYRLSLDQLTIIGRHLAGICSKFRPFARRSPPAIVRLTVVGWQGSNGRIYTRISSGRRTVGFRCERQWASTRELHAQYRPNLQPGVAGLDLGAVVEPEARHVDETALRVDADAVRPRRDDLAQFFAAHTAKGRRHDLPRVEQVEPLVAHRRPGARRRIAAADQIVDEIDVVRPVDAAFRFAHPALIGRLVLVLGRFGGAPGHDQLSGLDQRLDPEREDLVEIERRGGVISADRDALLEDHRAFVEPGGRAEDGEAGFLAAADDRPRYRRRPAMQRQQRGVELDHPVFRDRAEFRWREQQNIGHDADIGVEAFQCFLRFGVGVFRETVDRQLLFLGRLHQRVWTCARPPRRGEHADNRVAARQKGVERRFAEGLLTDDDDAHLFLPSTCIHLVATEFHATTCRGKGIATQRRLYRVARVGMMPWSSTSAMVSPCSASKRSKPPAPSFSFLSPGARHSPCRAPNPGVIWSISTSSAPICQTTRTASSPKPRPRPRNSAPGPCASKAAPAPRAHPPPTSTSPRPVPRWSMTSCKRTASIRR